MRPVKNMSNAHADSYSALVERPLKTRKGRGKHGKGRNAGVLSPQCRAGQHHGCIKSSCPCACGHGGIR